MQVYFHRFKDYKKYRYTLIKTIERANRNYYNRKLTEEKHNTGNVYKIVNEITKLKNTTRTFPNKLVGSSKYVATEPANIAQILNEHFAGIGHLVLQSIAEPPIHVNPVSLQYIPLTALHFFTTVNKCGIIINY